MFKVQINIDKPILFQELKTQNSRYLLDKVKSAKETAKAYSKRQIIQLFVLLQSKFLIKVNI